MIDDTQQHSRRGFLKFGGIAAAAIAAGGFIHLLRRYVHGQITRTAPASLYTQPMPMRTLGRTGVQVSLLGLGGQAVIEQRGRNPLPRAQAIIAAALDLGVNYIDTAPLYGAGLSETRIGAAIRGRRDRVFLATKTHDRTYDGTMRLAEQSLKRLQTDHFDLYQLHNVRVHEDLDLAFGRHGAVRAMQRLKDEGVTRFLGITGHRDPDVLLRGINEYDFDTILMALNAADIHYRPFQTELLETAIKKQMGVIAMKVTSMRRLFREDGLSSMEDALGYVYSFPVSTAIVGMSAVREVEEDAAIAKGFGEPLPPSRLTEIEAMTQSYAADANWYKTEWY